jgi:transcriptional regulator GlxA family with amidase domain
MKTLESPTRSMNTTSHAATQPTEPAFPAARTGTTAIGRGQRIDQSIHYMMDHLNQPLQVARLAALENVSASHYFALFKSRTGHSPIDFFIRLRMRRACQLLRGTSLSIKEIAATLGYDDPFYFSRIFKAIHNVAPRQYRGDWEARRPERIVALPSHASLELEQVG